MQDISIDFETRSTLDLNKVGVYRYVEESWTDIWCMAWAIGDGPVSVWTPTEPLPTELLEHVASGASLRAWNAAFERIIWNRILVERYAAPKLKRDRFVCTMAEAANVGLPRSLGYAAFVLGLKQQKDQEGRRLMLQMARPRKMVKGKPIWWDVEEKKLRLYDYCANDVETERGVVPHIPRMKERERSIYIMDQEMNDRGVFIDAPLVQAMKRTTKDALLLANEKIHELSEGMITSVMNHREVGAWVRSAGLGDNAAKSTITELLLDDGVQGVERSILEIRADSARTSISKLDSIGRTMCADGRVRGLLHYFGADTGRWAGRLVQPQNFPRGEVKNPEQYIPDIMAGRRLENPMPICSSLLRGTFIPTPGHRFLVADYAQIEARVLAWMAEQDDLVKRFASGGKVYEVMASKITGLPVSEIGKGSEERWMGKQTELGCGYQMGWKKFQKKVRKDALEQLGRVIDVDDNEAKRIISVYRDDKDMIVTFWKTIEKAALNAVRYPGRMFWFGVDQKCAFVYIHRWLWMALPTGRSLAYFNPRVVEGKYGPAVNFDGRNSMTGRWETRQGYGGFWTENAVQALSRDLLADAMLRIREAGYKLVLTVHDEIVAEARNGTGSLQEFLGMMEQVPAWARGCPVAVEGFETERYKKG